MLFSCSVEYRATASRLLFRQFLIAACSVIDPLSIGDSDAGSRVTLGLCVVTAKRDFPKVGQLQ